MRRSKIEIYLHMVWATENRHPFLIGDNERAMHRMLQQEAEIMNCDVLALNGMPDHVHLLLSLPATLCAANIARKLKGSSSSFAKKSLLLPYRFGWQDNYGAFSVSRSHIRRVIRYIENQQQHHSVGPEWHDWEETFIDDEPV